MRRKLTEKVRCNYNFKIISLFFVHDQIKTRFENERYLREHPEVSCLLTGFLGWVSIKLIGDIHNKEASSFHLEELLLDTYAYTTWAYVFTKIFCVFGFKSFKLLKIINFVFSVAWNVDCLIFSQHSAILF